MRTALLIVALLLVIPPTHCSVLFTTILLRDSETFSVKAFSSLVLDITNATSLTLHSVEPDTITGVDGRRLFADSSSFYSFQLLHVTRVLASVEVEDEKTVAAIILHSLPLKGQLRGLGIMGMESVTIGEADTQNWFTTTYVELPPFVAQYLILGWSLTVLFFASCVLCYCCRGDQKREVIPLAIVSNPNPAAITIPPPPPQATPPQRRRDNDE
jgi:hypothetical protein